MWLAAASGAAISHLIDQRIDKVMGRTGNRPPATGTLQPAQVLAFAVLLGAASMTLLIALVNPLTAALTFASLIGSAIIYTGFLKRATPQNIVIGDRKSTRLTSSNYRAHRIPSPACKKKQPKPDNVQRHTTRHPIP